MENFQEISLPIPIIVFPPQPDERRIPLLAAKQRFLSSEKRGIPFFLCHRHQIKRHTERREKIPDTVPRPPILACTALPASFSRGRGKPKTGKASQGYSARRENRRSRKTSKGDPFPGNSPAQGSPLFSVQQISILRGLPEQSSSFPRPGPRSPQAGTSACRALPSCRGIRQPSWG